MEQTMASDNIREVIKNKLRQTFDGRIVRKDLTKKIAQLTAEMKEAAKALDFEQAAFLRDEIVRLSGHEPAKKKP